MQKEDQKFPFVPTVSDRELSEGAVTVGEALLPLGYVSVHVGNWHMQDDPGRHGYLLHDCASDNNPGITLKAGLQKGEPTPRPLPQDLSDPKLMFSVTEKAIGFFEEQALATGPSQLQHPTTEALQCTTRESLDDRF